MYESGEKVCDQPNPTMNELPNGLDEVLNGLEMMAESDLGYRGLLCVLEVTVEMNSWFTNLGKPIHDRFNRIEDKIIPQITTEPRDMDTTRWDLAEEIQSRHGHMSIHAAEAAAEYYMDR